MNAAKPLERLGAARSLARKVPLFLDAIRFHETAFALPFAYTGMLLAARGLPSLEQLLWITVAMVGARTVGMSANRIIDRRLDAKNPRTAGRHLPSVRCGPWTSLPRGGLAGDLLRCGSNAQHTRPAAGSCGCRVPGGLPLRQAPHLGGEHDAGGSAGHGAVGGLDRGDGKPVLAAGPAVCRRGPVGQQLRHPLPRSGLRFLPARGAALGGVPIRDSRRLPVGAPLRRAGAVLPLGLGVLGGAGVAPTSWAGQLHWRCWCTSTAWSLPATSQG